MANGLLASLRGLWSYAEDAAEVVEAALAELAMQVEEDFGAAIERGILQPSRSTWALML